MEELKYKLQYYYQDFIKGTVCVEDTELISKEKALELFNKYYEDVKEKLSRGKEPQMAIFNNCEKNTYGDIFKEIDYRDNLIIENGFIYKINKVKL